MCEVRLLAILRLLAKWVGYGHHPKGSRYGHFAPASCCRAECRARAGAPRQPSLHGARTTIDFPCAALYCALLGSLPLDAIPDVRLCARSDPRGQSTAARFRPVFSIQYARQKSDRTNDRTRDMNLPITARRSKETGSQHCRCTPGARTRALQYASDSRAYATLRARKTNMQVARCETIELARARAARAAAAGRLERRVIPARPREVRPSEPRGAQDGGSCCNLRRPITHCHSRAETRHQRTQTRPNGRAPHRERKPTQSMRNIGCVGTSRPTSSRSSLAAGAAIAAHNDHGEQRAHTHRMRGLATAAAASRATRPLVPANPLLAAGVTITLMLKTTSDWPPTCEQREKANGARERGLAAAAAPGTPSAPPMPANPLLAAGVAVTLRLSSAGSARTRPTGPSRGANPRNHDRGANPNPIRLYSAVAVPSRALCAHSRAPAPWQPLAEPGRLRAIGH